MPGKKKEEPQDFFLTHYRQLIGKKVAGVLMTDDKDTMMTGPMYALLFDDGTQALILMDPEGNGPGFLDISKE